MMMKRALAILLAALMLIPSALPISAEDDDKYNDTTIDWGEHTTHIYDWCDDYSCNICGALRKDDHVYDNPCDATCNYCGNVRNVPGHQYDDEFCDEDCNHCGETRTVPHVYLNCDSIFCQLCGLERESGGHTYDDSLDPECNLCGAWRNIITIAAQPQSICVAEGEDAIATVAVTGDGLTYKWYWAKKGSNTFYVTTAFTGDTYSVSMTADRNGRKIYCVVTDKYGNSVQTQTVTIGMLPHAYVSTVTKAPTCTTVGVRTYTCTCGDSYVEAISPLGHTWNEATCTTPKTCATCGMTEGKALGHAYTDKVTKAPTCTAEGVKTYACSCGDSYTEAIPALGHTWNDATCTTPKTCKTCGATSGNALGHNHTENVTKAPTCTAEGVKTYTCACGDSYTEAIPALGHNWNDATCTTPKTCATCSATSGSALGHLYDHACDTDCNRCGTSRTVGDHIYDNACDANCNICGTLRQVPDHVYDNGNDTECNICGFHRDACNHQYNNACDASCNVPGCGYIRQVGDHVYDHACDTSCNICGALRSTTHQYVAATCTAPKTCSVCGATQGVALGHSYTSAVTKQPTCTVEGVKTYTCSTCSDSYTESIAALGHTWDDATCTAPKTCETCGAIEGEALGHSYTSAVTKNPTCTATGVKTYTCSACSAYYTEVISALGHTWDDATCTTPKTCSVCGTTEGEALGHSYDNDCDQDCNVCDWWRITTHVYDNDCDTNCNICDAARTVGDHVWKNGSCSICGIASPSQATITKVPATAAYAKEGAKVSVTITADGEGLKYQWYIKNDGASKYSKSSITSATYYATMSDKVHGRRIYCVVTDKYGNQVQSKTFMLRRQATITKEPATAAYAQMGKQVTVKITAKGDGLKYTWYIKNDGASKYTKSSITSATYSATMSAKVKGRRIYCVVKDKYGKTVQSKTFMLRESVSITTQPKTVTVAKNKTAKVTVKASGDGLKYQWYIKNDGASKYTKSSITKSTYSATMTSKVKNRLVYCVVTDKYGKTVKTVTVKLKMK